MSQCHTIMCFKEKSTQIHLQIQIKSVKLTPHKQT